MITATLTKIDIGVLVIYLGIMLLIGWRCSRKQEDEASYFLGGRNMPTWAVSISVLATALSAATFTGVPELAYRGNLSYLILNIGGILGALSVALLFLPPLYRSGKVTIYGFLEDRFGLRAKYAASFAFLVGRLLASGARLYIAGIAFSIILFGDIRNESLIMAILLFGIVGTIYVMWGGIKAVIWTDVIQFFVLGFGAILTVYLLLDQIPFSFSETIDLLNDFDGKNKLLVLDTEFDFSKSSTLWAGISVIFLNAASYGVDQDLAQRMLTTKSAGRASASLIISNLLSIPVICIFLFIGLLLAVFYAGPEIMGEHATQQVLNDTRQVFPQFILNHLPAGVTGLTIAGLFAAAMSSFDSAVNAMASCAVADLYIPIKGLEGKGHATQRLKISRTAVIIMGLLLTLFAVGAVFLQQAGNQSLIDFALGIMSFAYAGLLGIFLTAFLTRRGNEKSAIASMIIGALVVLLLQPYVLGPTSEFLFGERFLLAWPYWMAIATPISFLVCISGKPEQNNGMACCTT